MTEPQAFPPVLKHYRLVRELGRGGMGMVIEGVDRRDDSRVAVKILYPYLAAQDESYRDRFEREAHIAALLRSPYTVHLLDFGVEGGTYFFVMEYIEGRTLSADLRHGALEPGYALRVASETARALEEAGARGIVHRDIKPENILLDNENRVKVADFGIARQAAAPGVTAVGGFVGTPLYAAPEQAQGKADVRTDVYQLGATLYHMLAGQPPFHGSTTAELMRRHQEASLAMGPIAQLPDGVLNLVRRCLEKDPLDRYQSATELVGAIDRARVTVGRMDQPATGYSPPRGVPPVVIAPPAGVAAALGTHDLAAPTVRADSLAGPPVPTMDAPTVVDAPVRIGTGTAAPPGTLEAATSADEEEKRRRKAVAFVPLPGSGSAAGAGDPLVHGADPLLRGAGPRSYQAPGSPGGPSSYAAPGAPAAPPPPPYSPPAPPPDPGGAISGGPQGGGSPGGGAPGGAPAGEPGGSPSGGGPPWKGKGCIAVLVGAILAGLLGGLGFVLFSFAGGDDDAADDTPTATATATASVTVSPSASSSASATVTKTPSPSPSPSASPSASPSVSPSPTATNTTTATATPTKTATPTPTTPPTDTPTPTPTTPIEKVAPAPKAPLGPVAQLNPDGSLGFFWGEMKNVTSYRIQIFGVGCSKLLVNQETASTGYTIGLFEGDGGCWQVQANYPDGVPGPWSALITFRVQRN